MWGAQAKSEGAHQQIFGRRFAPAFCPPHLQIASDATGYEAWLSDPLKHIPPHVCYHAEFDRTI